MLMPPGTVNMAMLELFFSGVANFLNRYVKIERFTGQRMVAVYRDGVVGDRGHRDRDCITFLSLGFKLHADLNCVYVAERVAWNLFNHLPVNHTVAVLGRD